MAGKTNLTLIKGKHVCALDKSCICSIVALEPDDNCPVHGIPWPPRCSTCGRFLKWSIK